MENTKIDIINQDWINKYYNHINNNIFSFIEPINEITIFFIYLNKNNETEYFFKSNQKIDKVISMMTLFNLIENKKVLKDNYYKLKNLLKFELLIDNNNIKKFLDNDKYYIKLEPVKYYQDIYFEDNINIFKNINSLFFIFEEKISKDSKNITLKNIRKKNNKTKKSIRKTI